MMTITLSKVYIYVHRCCCFTQNCSLVHVRHAILFCLQQLLYTVHIYSSSAAAAAAAAAALIHSTTAADTAAATSAEHLQTHYF
jgi:hypothetical protein